MFSPDRIDDFIFKYRDLFLPEKDDSGDLIRCPDCLEYDEHLNLYGVCECKMIAEWHNTDQEMSYDEFKEMVVRTLKNRSPYKR